MSSLGYTGGSLVIYRLLDGLAQRGHDASIVTPFGRVRWDARASESVRHDPSSHYAGPWRVARRAQSWLRERLPIVERSIQEMRWRDADRRLARDTERIMQHWQPSDITIASHSFTALAVAQIRNETRAFYHMQGLETEFTDRADFKRIARRSYDLPLRKIANSTWLRDRVRALTGSSDDMPLLCPGVDHRIFHPDQDTFAKFSSSGPLIVVSYADPRPVKGWADSVEAMRIFRANVGDRREIQWIVFGSLSVAATTGVDVRSLGIVSHARLADLYRSAHLFFMPSWIESFPLPPLEAMASGAAVITTSPGVSDYALDRETARVVDPRDPTALADALTEVSMQPRLQERLARSGLEMARRFTWNAAVSRLDEIVSVPAQPPSVGPAAGHTS
jgi:glycosyltransferase involved in cell wall biosynthesis